VSAPVQRLRDQCQSVRFVYDMRTGEITEVAIRHPSTWQWEFIRLENETERAFRHAAIGLLADAFTKGRRCTS
jgi:hypothetical protein